MNPSLREETEKLTRSWMRHDSEMLRDYLVAEVEDPRVNLQSIFTRHFLAWELFGDRFEPLMREEYRFSAVMNSLRRLAGRFGDAEERDAVLHALRQGADNAEGLEIPQHIVQAYASLPRSAPVATIPNYIQEFLERWAPGPSAKMGDEASLNTFQDLWRSLLLPGRGAPAGVSQPEPLASNAADAARTAPPSVLEPACGSANDYRFLERYGFAARIAYSGFDLCPKNVENARRMFPGTAFNAGNVFEIDAPGLSFDYCFVHDLFEHLSPEGIETAVREVCRVTRKAMCAHFFSMDEIREHVIQPVDDYHWNLLSMERMRGLFSSYGFEAQVFHLGTFLLQRAGAGDYHNPTAYTFLLRRRTSYS